MKVRLRRTSLCWCMALLCMPLLWACDGNAVVPPTPATQTLRIYSSLPNKGVAAYESKLMRQAIELALKVRDGRVGAWSVEYVALDGGSDENGETSPRIEAANAILAANDPQAVAYIGPYTSGATSAALPITNRAHLLTLGPTATWPGLTLDRWEAGEPEKYYPTGKRHYARLSMPDSRQGEAAARWAASRGLKRAFLLNDGSTYSKGLAASFSVTAKEIGLDVVGEAAIAPDSSTALVEKIVASGAASLFFAPSNTGSAINLARLLFTQQVEVAVFASDTAMSDQFIEAAGREAENWRVIFNGGDADRQTAEWQQFAQRFQEAYGVQPSRSAGNAYDLTNLVLDAIAAEPAADREKIAGRVLGTQGYRGASGRVTFDGEGDHIGTRMVGYKVENGRYVLERVIEY